MGKGSGGARHNSDTQKALNLAEFQARISGEGVKRGMSFYDANSGGYVIWESGHKEKDGKNNPEYIAAAILARNGYRVVLTPEGDGKPGAISIKRTAKGNKTYVDGLIDFQTYEQHTPTTVNNQKGVFSSLTHGHDKGAEVVLIHDYHNLLHRTDIAKGIELYNQWTPPHGNKVVFKAIIVVNAKEEVHDWYL